MHIVYKTVEKAYIKKAVERIAEIERKRFSLPNVTLTEIEIDTLVAVAQGRKAEEINKAIKLVDEFDSYHGVTQRIIRKLEAFSLIHAACKAVKLGLLDVCFIKEYEGQNK